MTTPPMSGDTRGVEACPYGGPVVTLDELGALDTAEIIEGYWDGYDNGPRPSGNRSKAYWHGWRNGMVDGKHAEIDPAQRALVRAVIARDRALATPTSNIKDNPAP